jgi:hypothetical protein
MKRAFILSVIFALGLLLASCQHWVGISSTQLIKRMGEPINIVPSGSFTVYTYLDGLGGAPMKFYLDKDGIVRKWDASPVPADFGTGIEEDTVLGVPTN